MRRCLLVLTIAGCGPAEATHFEPFEDPAVSFFEANGARCTWKTWSDGATTTIGELAAPCDSIVLTRSNVGGVTLAQAPTSRRGRNTVPLVTWRASERRSAFWIADREAGTFSELAFPREIRRSLSARIGFDADGALHLVADTEHVSLLEKVRGFAGGTPKVDKETIVWDHDGRGWKRAAPDPNVMSWSAIVNSSSMPLHLTRDYSTRDVDDATAAQLRVLAPGHAHWRTYESTPGLFFEDGERRRLAYRDGARVVLAEAPRSRAISPLVVVRGDFALSLDARDGSVPVLYDLRAKKVLWQSDTAKLAIFWPTMSR